MLLHRGKLHLILTAVVLAVICILIGGNGQAANAAPLAGTGTWSIQSQSTYQLRDISMVSPRDGWIVGYEYRAGNGADVGSVILHWDGSTWTRITSPTNRPLYAVKMITAEDGWAVGYLGTRLHWDGETWTDQSCSSVNCYTFYSVDFSSPNDVWAVGEHGFHHWDGTTWQTSSNAAQDIYNDIFVISSTDAWIVGQYGASYPYQTITMHWNGTSWTRSVQNTCSYGLRAVEMVSPTSGWAVGGSNCVMRYTGSWERLSDSISYTSLQDIAMLSETDGWVVGGTSSIPENSQGVTVRWNGSTWQEVENPAPQIITDIDALSANEAWAIGWEGSISHYTNYQQNYLPLVTR